MSNATDCKVHATTSPVLVYDDACGVCSRSVQFVLRHERRHDLLFTGRESELGKELRRTHGLEGVESMIWVESGQAFTQSLAAMKIADYLGGPWSFLASLVRLCPAAVRNALYGVFARNRRRLPMECPMPTPQQRARFLA